ncbi:MAG: hypothetical protein IJ744_02090 [Lachnospiraceae bacterium]|nr:hypothetical protein [Lachnospiraceae bacterium]
MEQILCVSNSYEKKYYLDPKFQGLPEAVRQELQILCVLFTEEVGGILTVSFEEDGSIYLMPMAEEEDILYDEIGSALKIGQMRRDHRELFESLELYYQLFIKKEEEA